MPIFRTALSSNYAQISNAFADTPMKFQAKALLLHLLVKPPEWRVNKAAIAKTLDLSIYIVGCVNMATLFTNTLKTVLDNGLSMTLRN
jgi:hypothetical protein